MHVRELRKPRARPTNRRVKEIGKADLADLEHQTDTITVRLGDSSPAVT
jgi:hypothetical protein